MNLAANQVRAGAGPGYVARAGVEMMSRVAMGSDGAAIAVDPSLALKTYFVPQGIAADIVATEYGFTRDDCDLLAVESQRRAARAWEERRFDGSVVPVTDVNGLTILDPRRSWRARRRPCSPGRVETRLRRGPGRDQPGFDAVAVHDYSDVWSAIEHVHHAGNLQRHRGRRGGVLIGSQEAGDTHGLKPRARVARPPRSAPIRRSC